MDPGRFHRQRVRRLQQALRLQLREAGRARVYLAGVCMAPLLPAGQRITLESRAPRRGEVVVYETPEGWKAHRVVGQAEDALLIRADRPGSGVERIAPERVVGVWVGRRLGLSPGVGRAVQQVSSALSHPRILPVLGRLKRELQSRAPLPRGLGLRELDPPEPSDLAGLSALGLWQGAVETDSRFWVIEAAGRARGGLHLLRQEDRGLIQIQLEPALRGRGFGRALLQAAIRWAEAEGLASLHAEIARGNAPSRRLFLAAGFRRVADRIGIHFQREEVIDAYRLLLREEPERSSGL